MFILLGPNDVLEAEKSTLVRRPTHIITEGHPGFQHLAEAFRHVPEDICRS